MGLAGTNRPKSLGIGMSLRWEIWVLPYRKHLGELGEIPQVSARRGDLMTLTPFPIFSREERIPAEASMVLQGAAP